MKYSITKKKVLDAILTENLQAGSFFDEGRDTKTEEYGVQVDCPVCAVGAILRKTKKGYFYNTDGYKVTQATGHGDSWHLTNARNGANFFSLLSCEFESMEASDGIEIARYHAWSIAYAHCPAVLEFEV